MTASQELQGQTRNMALLIDGDNALLHAYHTTSGWTTSKGVGQSPRCDARRPRAGSDKG